MCIYINICAVDPETELRSDHSTEARKTCQHHLNGDSCDFLNISVTAVVQKDLPVTVLDDMISMSHHANADDTLTGNFNERDFLSKRCRKIGAKRHG